MSTIARLSIALAMLAALSCSAPRGGKENAPPPTGAGTSREGTDAGRARAPGTGSKETQLGSGAAHAAAEGAFCAEHGVPESVCTLCNPALAAEFKAKGDWCEEHGLPESYCPICHPELAPKGWTPPSADGAPRDGTQVRFKSAETARMAGIATEPAAPAPGEATVQAVARIAYDASRTAAVNARSEGVVRQVLAEVGARVHRGSPLAVIESAGVGADRSRIQSAQAREDATRADYERAHRLNEAGITAMKEVLDARKEWEAAKADLAATQASLAVVDPAGDGSSRYTLTAPIAGVVTAKEVSVGRLVDTEDTLFHIVDPSRMWAEIDVREQDLGVVAPGQTATLTVDGLEDRLFEGTLDYIAPEIDPRTRTAKGRVSLANPDGALRANMFARATIVTRADRSGVVVPSSALQHAKGIDLVFVRLSESLYEARRVRARGPEGTNVEVVGNLHPGDPVVTDGSFLLKTETLKGSIGAGCCEVR